MICRRGCAVTWCRPCARSPGCSAAPPPSCWRTCRSLRRQLDRLHPVALGISPKRLANLRADLARALKTVGASSQRQRSSSRLAPEWQTLMDACPKGYKWRLSRFFHWCSENKLRPADVDAETLQHFIDELEQSSLAANPVKLRTAIAAAWNKGQENIPGWPDTRFERAPDLRRWTYRLTEFPGSFLMDVESYLARLAGEEIPDDDDDGPPRPARPGTLTLRRWHIRYAASAAVHTGVAKDDLRSLRDLFTGDRFRTTIRWLAAHYKGSRTTGDIAMTLRSIAKHYLKLPEPELKKLRTRTAARRAGLTEKNRDRLRPFDDPERYDRLITLPQMLIKRARPAERDPGARRPGRSDGGRGRDSLDGAAPHRQSGDAPARQAHPPRSRRPRQRCH